MRGKYYFERPVRQESAEKTRVKEEV